MKKAEPQNPPPLETEPDTRRELSLALDTLDCIARDVLARIARDPVRGHSTHEYHGDLAAIELAVSDLLVPLARRRM